MWIKSFVAVLTLVACEVDGDDNSMVAVSVSGTDGADVESDDVDDSSELESLAREEDALDGASAAFGAPDESERRADPTAPRWFGCPLFQYQCDSHCESKPGYKGGYCKGFLKKTCKCY